jgi:hypothetical protein
VATGWTDPDKGLSLDHELIKSQTVLSLVSTTLPYTAMLAAAECFLVGTELWQPGTKESSRQRGGNEPLCREVDGDSCLKKQLLSPKWTQRRREFWAEGMPCAQVASVFREQPIYCGRRLKGGSSKVKYRPLAVGNCWSPFRQGKRILFPSCNVSADKNTLRHGLRHAWVSFPSA